MWKSFIQVYEKAIIIYPTFTNTKGYYFKTEDYYYLVFTKFTV
ncbi:hypothetical protein FM107_03145 [Sphingobacterium sp. JB170]|nr:hypothetical protein FM107_03145 [Sphingobacterium sp. JB170]